MPVDKVKLSELKARVLDRADMSGTGFIDSSRLVDYINSANAELHDLIVATHEDYFLKIQTFSLTTSESYVLPEDFYKSRKVFLLDGGERTALKRFNLDELDHSEGTVAAIVGDTRYLRYRIIGDKIYFTPNPNAQSSIEHWYIHDAERLVDDDDTLNYSVPSGWDEYIVVDAAMRCLEKEESDVTALMAHKETLKQRIIMLAQSRDTGEPDRIIDVAMRQRPWWTYV